MDTKATILYTDDEPLNLQLFEINFSKKYNVVTAISGFKGLEILENNPGINIIISDMKMPGMNGLEFIMKVKSLYPEIPCYILTGYEITEEIQTALNNNMVHRYFSKPFNIPEIDSAIMEAVIHEKKG